MARRWRPSGSKPNWARCCSSASCWTPRSLPWRPTALWPAGGRGDEPDRLALKWQALWPGPRVPGLARGAGQRVSASLLLPARTAPAPRPGTLALCPDAVAGRHAGRRQRSVLDLPLGTPAAARGALPARPQAGALPRHVPLLLQGPRRGCDRTGVGRLGARVRTARNRGDRRQAPARERPGRARRQRGCARGGGLCQPAWGGDRPSADGARGGRDEQAPCDALWDGPPPDLEQACTVEKGHGRLETRRIATSREVVPHLDWPGVAQVGRIEREREIRGQTSREVAYAVTSLTREQAGPEALLSLVRGHWAIENQLHWRRDVSLREDACRVRSGCAPQALAALRNTVLRLARALPGPLAAVRETLAENRLDAILLATQGFL